MERFRKAVEARDADALVASLAEDVEFLSPIAFRPYRGRDSVGFVLRGVMRVFEDFRYTDALESTTQGALVFEASVGGRKLDGIDLIEMDEAGLVKRLTVFVRPLSAATALADAMAKQPAGG